MSGVVHLVGAGPGAADLLTVRAARLLAEADVVLHDALVGPEILALAARARRIDVGKRANRPSTEQRFIGRLLVRLARRHACVVRLKGGDPMMFGRASEEIAACRAAGIEVVCTPGVTAGLGAASALCVSLTERGVSRSVAWVTPSIARGGVADESWAAAAAAAETAVIYMGRARAGEVVETLRRRGAALTTPIALIESVSLGEERVLLGDLADLPRLAAAMGAGPVVLILGEVLRGRGVTLQAAAAA